MIKYCYKFVVSIRPSNANFIFIYLFFNFRRPCFNKDKIILVVIKLNFNYNILTFVC